MIEINAGVTVTAFQPYQVQLSSEYGTFKMVLYRSKRLAVWIGTRNRLLRSINALVSDQGSIGYRAGIFYFGKRLF
jgi:hypothetical protein